ncbi:MAG TPA: hypothetical protein VHE59_08145 [Mucilaginibacter sp.]|nr:hypothetical protein [Mucilaginibacter sp.]
MEKGYRKLVYFLLILGILVAFGFYKPYFALFPNFDKNITLLVHIHATALLIWVFIIILQPILILKRKYRIHRILGKFSYFLVPVIVITSIGVMRKQYIEYIAQKITPADSLKALVISFAEIATFSLFYLLAVIHRRNIALHMRYIICTALVLITPSLARVMGYWFDAGQLESYITCFIVSDAILISLILYDRSKRKKYMPYVTALILFLIFHIGWYLAGHPY